MKQLDLKMIRLLTSPQAYLQADTYLQTQKATILEAKDERVKAEVVFDEEAFQVIIQKNEERNFDTSCTCDSDTKHPLCIHKSIVFVQLLNSFGVNYFDSIRNWDKEKNKLLEAYGYSLTDDLKGKFEFAYKEGKPFLRVLDTSIKRISPVSTGLKPRVPETSPVAEMQVLQENAKPALLQLGLVFTENEDQYPFITVEAIQGEPADDGKSYAGKIKKIDLAKYINTDLFNDEDKLLVQQLRKLQSTEVTKYLNRNSPFSGIWENIIQQHSDELPEETRHLIVEYLHPRFKKMFADAHAHFSFALPEKKAFVTHNLVPILLSDEPALLQFNINYTNGEYEVACTVKINHLEVASNENERISSLVFAHDNTY